MTHFLIATTAALLFSTTSTAIEWQGDGTVKVSATVEVLQASDGYTKAPNETDKAAQKACKGKGRTTAKRVSKYEFDAGDNDAGQFQATVTATYECS